MPDGLPATPSSLIAYAAAVAPRVAARRAGAAREADPGLEAPPRLGENAGAQRRRHGVEDAEFRPDAAMRLVMGVPPRRAAAGGFPHLVLDGPHDLAEGHGLAGWHGFAEARRTAAALDARL